MCFPCRCRSSASPRRRRFPAQSVLSSLAVSLILLPAVALADLELVEEHYLFGEYPEAIQLLRQLADRDPAAAGSIEHQVWQARCLVQAGELEEAMRAFCRARELSPDWQPDPVLVPADEREVFLRAIEECPSKPAEAVIEQPPQPSPPGLPPPSVPLDLTRRQAVMRSLIPGMGQFYKGQSTRGSILAGAATATAGIAVWGHLQRNSRFDTYEQARDDYRAAVAHEEIDRTFAVLQDRADAVSRSEKLRDIGLYSFIGVYALNLVDAALGFPLDGAGGTMTADGTDGEQLRLGVSFALP